jgi:hypothetical protein
MAAARDIQEHHDSVRAGWLVIGGAQARFDESGTLIESPGAGIVGPHVEKDLTALTGRCRRNEIVEQSRPNALTLALGPHRNRLDVAPFPGNGVEAPITGDPISLGHDVVKRAGPSASNKANKPDKVAGLVQADEPDKLRQPGGVTGMPADR